MSMARAVLSSHLLFEVQGGRIGPASSIHQSERVMFRGIVAGPGFGHFSTRRPKFYQAVLDLTGVTLYHGTINVKIHGAMPLFPLASTQRIPAQDQIDFDDKQDILITPCAMEGCAGFWILPVFKGTWDPNPLGHFPKQIIEISLVEKLPNICPELPVSLEISDALTAEVT